MKEEGEEEKLLTMVIVKCLLEIFLWVKSNRPHIFSRTDLKKEKKKKKF